MLSFHRLFRSFLNHCRCFANILRKVMERQRQKLSSFLATLTGTTGGDWGLRSCWKQLKKKKIPKNEERFLVWRRSGQPLTYKLRNLQAHTHTNMLPQCVLKPLLSWAYFCRNAFYFLFFWRSRTTEPVLHFKFFIEVCNLTCPFDHIQTSEVCKTPYIPPGL